MKVIAILATQFAAAEDARPGRAAAARQAVHVR